MSISKIISDLKARFSGAFEKPSGDAQSQKLSAADQKLLQDMLAGMTAQIQREQRMENARGKEPVSVRLVPQVPVRDHRAARAWLGGGARLAPGIEWPMADGSAFQLLAQIDWTLLPKGLWGGLGPRMGWLAIFLDPVSLAAKIFHFAEAGDFKRSPPVLEDCNITGYDGRQRAKASGYTWSFPAWPIDVVAVTPGRPDPRQAAESGDRHERYGRRHDLVVDQFLPFDWPTTLMMLDTAVAAYEKARPQGAADFLQPEALEKAEQAIVDAERAGKSAEALCGMRVSLDERRAMAQVRAFALQHAEPVIERLRALKAKAEAMSTGEVFSAEAIAPIVAEMHSMSWMHKRTPPFYRNGQKLSETQRFHEGVEVLTLPLTTHDPSAAPTWVHEFETALVEAAKTVYVGAPSALPAALAGQCEKIWASQAKREIGGMGHVPWGYVHEFDEDADVTLIKLPTSYLVGWMFGDVNSLVITLGKKALSRGDFSRPRVQITN